MKGYIERDLSLALCALFTSQKGRIAFCFYSNVGFALDSDYKGRAEVCLDVLLYQLSFFVYWFFIKA